MAIQLTSGLMLMPSLPAAQIPQLRIALTNLENRPHQASVAVYRLEGETLSLWFEATVEVAGNERQHVVVPDEYVGGQKIEVVASVPLSSFGSEAYAVVPDVSAVTVFIGDGSQSVLQFISSDGFELLREGAFAL